MLPSKTFLKCLNPKCLSYHIFLRKTHSTCEFTEVKIPVPWGHIAGKQWGNESGQPVLALHGIFDNLALFDQLIPLLKINRPVLAIDLPAHGRSSSPPPGLSPNFLELIVWLRYLIKHVFKWEKVTFIGHSLGSNLSFTYSGIFPNEVDKYISIDCSRSNMASRSEFLISDLRLAYSGRSKQKSKHLLEGTYEDFFDYTMKSRKEKKMPITKETCTALLSRELEKVGGNYFRSTVDPRLYLRYISRPSEPFLDALSKKINCEVLSIRATDGVIKGKHLEIYENHLSNMKKNCSKIVSTTLEGSHHLHTERPNEVADVINDFFR